ncbi:hypothetical protein NPIL_291931 [Nephila pilipes]|uniref:Uncharacterized protein n=1 Tax=Nephila pilipes TaxID=299642 RepID=A0A8X6PTB1_NEPPI|nr:hypothetical protein NPIL_291931 [Nephila pilipes]
MGVSSCELNVAFQMYVLPDLLPHITVAADSYCVQTHVISDDFLFAHIHIFHWHVVLFTGVMVSLSEPSLYSFLQTSRWRFRGRVVRYSLANFWAKLHSIPSRTMPVPLHAFMSTNQVK